MENSFELALEQLENNAVTADGAKALMLCGAADDMLAALKSAAMALDLAGLVPGDAYWQQQCKAAARTARAAIVTATGSAS
jgi:hypothetical protein